jgi:hypothetical protein
MSAAMMALGGMGGYGGSALRQQVGEDTDELRKKKQLEGKLSGFSPAGVTLAGMGLLGL